ncbi:hypothetical protein [Streptomyces pseudogriseolus]|uniref:hypothetical protein n=1 Tax=Streptomyces pseudogriseolus TaxID=36817 RepID=UPI003FA28C77
MTTRSPAYRFLADEARGAGAVMADRTAWRICRDNCWWSVFGKKRGKGRKTGPPLHDDLVRRVLRWEAVREAVEEVIRHP